MTEKREPTLLQAFIPVVFLIILLFVNVGLFGDNALDGSNQIILILSAAIAAIVAIVIGYKWGELQTGIVKSISSAMGRAWMTPLARRWSVEYTRVVKDAAVREALDASSGVHPDSCGGLKPTSKAMPPAASIESSAVLSREYGDHLTT